MPLALRAFPGTGVAARAAVAAAAAEAAAAAAAAGAAVTPCGGGAERPTDAAPCTSRSR